MGSPRSSASISSTSSRSTPTNGSQRQSHSTLTTSMPRSQELDARYLAGEAAPYSEAWSVVKESFDAYNRRERPPTMHDFANVDNRRGTAFQSGDMIAFMGATWADTPDVKLRIESVHRLRAGGAVVTWTATRKLGRGVRSRVASHHSCHGARRDDHSFGVIRRNGPRRRAREVRRTQPTGPAA